jgi:hypothetical protein
MRSFELLLTLVLTVGTAACMPAYAAPPVVNPQFAKAYESVARDMTDDALNLEHSDVAVADLCKRDGDNALAHYAAARLAAWSEKWDVVAAEIEAGNKAPYTIHYQRGDGPAPLFPLNATMRQLARAVSEGAPKMGPEKAVPLLKSFRTASRKLAWSEPKNPLSLLTAMSLRSITGTALVSILPAQSAEAAEAQKTLDADRAFSKRMTEDFRKSLGEDTNEPLLRAMERQKVTVEQVQAYHNGGKVTPAFRTKMLAIKKDRNAVERPVVVRWLKQLPD